MGSDNTLQKKELSRLLSLPCAVTLFMGLGGARSLGEGQSPPSMHLGHMFYPNVYKSSTHTALGAGEEREAKTFTYTLFTR